MGCIRNKTETIEFLVSFIVCHHYNDLLRIAKTKNRKERRAINEVAIWCNDKQTCVHDNDDKYLFAFCNVSIICVYGKWQSHKICTHDDEGSRT